MYFFGFYKTKQKNELTANIVDYCMDYSHLINNNTG